jgi:hypothetical protein
MLKPMMNSFKCYLLAFLLVLLASCASQLTDREKNTIYVANDYLVFHEQRYQTMSELVSIFKCSESVNVYLSPLINTHKDRFSMMSSEFLSMCGPPKKITIMFENSSKSKQDNFD